MPHSTVLSTPNNPSGVFTVLSSTPIQAPAAETFKALCNLADYAQWNSFTPQIDLVLKPGEKGRLYANMSGMPQRWPVGIQVSVYEPESYRIGWIGVDAPAWILHPERIQEVVSTENGDGCEYRSYETFAGPLAYLVKWLVGGKLDRAAVQVGQDLKKYMETGGGSQRRTAVAAT